MAHSNAYLTDPNPSDPRVIGMINFSHSDGTTTGGLDVSVYPDPDTYLNSKMDARTALGVMYHCLNRPFGNHIAANRHCPGHYPFDYPISASAGDHLLCDMQTQLQCETRLGATTYTTNLKAALDTPGRIGSVYGLYSYMAPLAGDYTASAPNLLTDTGLISYLGLKPIIDVQSVLSNTNSAPPPIMGANCLAWFEANELTYDNSLVLTTTDSTAIRRWNSQIGSNRADQTTVASQPLLKTGLTNGGKTFSAIQFDGTDDWMAFLSTVTFTTAFTMIAVIKADTQEGTILSSDAAVNLWRVNDVGAASMSIYNQSGTPDGYMRGFPGTGPAANTWAVVRLDYGGAGGAGRIFVNGTEVTSYAANTVENGFNFNFLGARADSGKSVFFKGLMASLAFVNVKATDNQVALMEAYMGAKYGVTLTGGSPTLPHLAFVNELAGTYTTPVYRENFNYRTISSLSSWDSGGAGILDADWQVGGNAEDAIADPTNFYTKDNVTGRGIIMIPNNGPSAALRAAGAILWLGRGYDVIVDFDGFTDEQITSVLNWDTPAGPTGEGALGLWPQLARLRNQQRWPLPPR